MSHHEEKDLNRQGANDKAKGKPSEIATKTPGQNPAPQQGRPAGNREQENKNREGNSSGQIRRDESDRNFDR